MKNPYMEDFSHRNLCLRPNFRDAARMETKMIDLDMEVYRAINEQIKINEIRYLASGDDSDTFLCNKICCKGVSK